MNSLARYRSDLSEAMAEDPQGTTSFINSEREKALNSYPKDVSVRYCSICNEPMVYQSAAYDEGYHFDNCI